MMWDDDTEPDLNSVLAEYLQSQGLEATTDGCLHAIPRNYPELNIEGGRLPLSMLKERMDDALRRAQRTMPKFPSCQYGGNMQITWDFNHKEDRYDGQFFCQDCAKRIATVKASD
jgi:hypothetical protein